MQDQAKKVFRIGGMDCASCANTLQKRISALPGAKDVEVHFATAKMTLHYDGDEEKLKQAVKQAGYTIEEPVEGQRYQHTSFWRSHPLMMSTIGSGVLFLTGILLSFFDSVQPWISILFYLGAIIVGGYRIAYAGITGLKTRTIGIEFLVTIAVLGAMAIGEWTEGAAVIFLFSLGETLEAYTMDRTRRSVRSLMDLAPAEARIRRGDEEMVLPVEQIAIGDILIVRPGEKIAMDGKVVSGHSAVNEASITGESMPVEKNKGDIVFAGTLNQLGALEVKVTRLAKDNTISRIVEMIEEAQARKAPSQKFVDVFARYYTPAVIFVAIGIAVIPPIVFGQDFATWFYRALVTLVVACPCALVISTPVSIVSAIGNAARNGVLIKGGIFLEQLGAISAIAFDKTGTLTLGFPKVTHIETLTDWSERELIRVAASVESRSEHPLAQAILRLAVEREIEWPKCKDFRSFLGKGAVARVEGRNYYIGSPDLFRETLGVALSTYWPAMEALQKKGSTVILIGMELNEEEGNHSVTKGQPSIQLLGYFALTDQIREQSKPTIDALSEVGIQSFYMLTGDNQGTAEAVGRLLGDAVQVRAELLPEDKMKVMDELLSKHGQVAMVGDGVNDAPALAKATIGIAMGTAGSDTALETADVALMADDLSKLPFTVKLSRRTLKIIKQNIGFSLLVKLLFLLMIIPGWVTLWLAVIADVGSSLLVILNGMRLLRNPSD